MFIMMQMMMMTLVMIMMMTLVMIILILVMVMVMTNLTSTYFCHDYSAYSQSNRQRKCGLLECLLPVFPFLVHGIHSFIFCFA